MKTLKSIFVLAMSLYVVPSVWALSTSLQDAQSLQTRKVFVNQSGSVITSGSAVVLIYSSSNSTTGWAMGASTSLGEDIATTTTASDRNFVGIVADASCPDQGACTVVTSGPALARFDCSGTNALQGNFVGTSTTAGQLAGGTRAGILLSNVVGGTNPSLAGCLKWIYVQPMAQ